MPDFDAVIIGAGHNALVCGGYLAKAGYRVCVVERRAVAGGAVVTEEVVPGFRFDLGGSAHILIHHTPIVADLELGAYGLDYIDLDPLFYAPYPDGSSLTVYKDVERTCEAIARISPVDGERYRQFIDEWGPIAEVMVDAFLHPPSPLNLGRYLGYRMYKRSKVLWDVVNTAFRGYGQVVRQSFSDVRVQSLVAWMAAQSGPPPGEPLSAPFALWHPMYHVSGMKRPRGGSGMLTQALARMIEGHGGMVRTDAEVGKILVEQGRATGVRLVSGDIVTGRVVVSGAHIHTTFKLLPEDAVPPAFKARVEQSRIGNGFGMVVRHAMEELPDYVASPSRDRKKPEAHHQALQMICPDLGYLERAYGDYLGGRPSRDPALVAMTFSAADPSLAPPDKHTLFLWGQYYPYELAGGEAWESIAEREADRMLATLAAYAPNVSGAVIDRLVQTPVYLEKTLGLLRGNVMHLEMSIDQMFAFRPAVGMSMYRAPVRGLYLTGASTHPGGGIMGAAGMNAAAVVLKDLGRSGGRGRR